MARAEAMSTLERQDAYERWMQRVDDALYDTVGIGAADLPDCDWWNWWAEGISPLIAARRCIEGY